MPRRHATGRNIERVRVITGSPPTLFDEASARLPLFDDLPDGAVDRLAAGGFGRGLLTAALRARLRKGGFADMGALALASPAALMAVRKVGPVRVHAIRTHVLDELARIVPGARAEHGQDATDRRRLDRLRFQSSEWLLHDPALTVRSTPAGPIWASLASMPRAEAARTLGISGTDLEGIVSALVPALLPDPPCAAPATLPPEDDAVREARTRAELLQDQDREWDEAAPAE